MTGKTNFLSHPGNVLLVKQNIQIRYGLGKFFFFADHVVILIINNLLAISAKMFVPEHINTLSSRTFSRDAPLSG